MERTCFAQAMSSKPLLGACSPPFLSLSSCALGSWASQRPGSRRSATCCLCRSPKSSVPVETGSRSSKLTSAPCSNSLSFSCPGEMQSFRRGRGRGGVVAGAQAGAGEGGAEVLSGEELGTDAGASGAAAASTGSGAGADSAGPAAAAAAGEAGKEAGIGLTALPVYQHILLPVMDRNPQLNEATKQVLSFGTALARATPDAKITVVVIDEDEKEDSTDHQQRLESIRFHLSQGGFSEYGLLERLGEGKMPAAVVGEVADDLELDLVVLPMEAVHHKHIDCNLLAEFTPCPVMLLPL